MARGPRGGFPGGGFPGSNPNQLMQQVQKMQREMEKAQEEIAEMTAEATAGGNAVRVVVGGDKQVKELVIEPAVIDPDDVEMLQDLIIVAVNEAYRLLEEKSEARMSKVAGGRNMPFGF